MAVDGERERFLVELVRTSGDPVSGSVTAEGRDAGTPFCGWLELLALLEAPPKQQGVPAPPTDTCSHRCRPPARP